MLGRGIVSRVVADLSKPSTVAVDVAKLSRRFNQPQASKCTHSAQYGGRIRPSTLYLRSFSTTSVYRDEAHAPTTTVRKSVKDTAKTKRAKKPAETSSDGATKKPRKPKQKAPKTSPTKNAVRPKKKKLTDEEKLREKVTNLKKLILDPPQLPTFSAWRVLFREYAKERYVGKPREEILSGEATKAARDKYNSLTPAEREHYNHLANEENATIEARYAEWLKSHTPEEIRTANNARRMLLKIKQQQSGKEGSENHVRVPGHLTVIKDDRLKGGANSYAKFLKERWASGDFKGIPVGEAGKNISEEWKALSDTEKQRYKEA